MGGSGSDLEIEMKTIIGWSFLLVSPILLGALLVLVCLNLAGLSHDYMSVAFPTYTVAWLFAYVTWFDGSDYQKL